MPAIAADTWHSLALVHGGNTVQNHVLMAKWWLHENQNK
jgi:hypothetical protein